MKVFLDLVDTLFRIAIKACLVVIAAFVALIASLTWRK